MSPANNPRPQGTPVQPTLSSLLARYLERQAEAQARGLAAADPVGEGQPYAVGPGPADRRPAGVGRGGGGGALLRPRRSAVLAGAAAVAAAGGRPRAGDGAAVLRRQLPAAGPQLPGAAADQEPGRAARGGRPARPRAAPPPARPAPPRPPP